MEWISVEESLPLSNQVVLLGFFEVVEPDDLPLDENPDADCFVQLGRIYHPSFIDEQTISLLAGAPDNHFVSIGCTVKATHWMPIPNPPEGETK